MLNRESLKRLSISGIVILVFTLGLREINQTGASYANFPDRVIAENEKSVSISIPTGATGAEIAALLKAAGVVASAESFFRAAVANPKAGSIAPGTHSLSLKISGNTALDQLLDPKRITDLIKIVEGAWNSEVFAQMVATKNWSTNPAQSAKQVVLPKGITALEGVLFPAQYSFAEGTSQVEALQGMVNRFNEAISTLDFVDPAGKLNTQQLVTLASLVQAEGDTKDFANISRVIRNRLAIGMQLQLDSTVHYLKNTRGEIYLSNKSTKLKSPYNTYQNYGLPPAPIGNPGLAALRAAISPAEGDWLFFITVAPGDTRFTKSFSEFNSWKSLYQKNRKAGAFE
ncbi:MAG: endolytic transglycosylase MltG [Actinobacteria bacterium]|nr:endolytic transglycosylase MltG [Actinomycetota bacterium]